jgi:shikimate dehydrogenase
MRRGLALVGDARIVGSASPAIHDAIFGAGTYGIIVDDDAGRAFARAEATVWGINVTAPHKLAAAARYADVLDDAARRTGAVNTVVYAPDGQATLATNTDVEGLRLAWRRANVVIEGRRLAVIGAGGAARAVVVAAADAGARGIIVHARRREAGAGLVSLAATVGVDATLAGVDRGAADLLVVAASELDGVDGWLDRTVRAAGVVHDLRYGARALSVRNAALRRGLVFLDGASMLLGQALAAARHFAGANPPIGIGGAGGTLDEAARARAAAALATALREG